VDALDAGFYAAFGAVEPTGKRMLLALDVSGSMSFNQISNMPITPREASAALALVTANVEKDYAVVGFTSSGRGFSRSDTGLSELDISPRMRLDTVIQKVSNLNFGGTDCALPWVIAKQQGWKVDTCVTYTDNETWAGRIHPHQALRDYRSASGIPARSVVCGMTSTGFSIADPKDAGSLDVAGFDSAVPGLISDFARG
jgi:60 kDa SS-A/Ro ribonucleoprotein